MDRGHHASKAILDRRILGLALLGLALLVGFQAGCGLFKPRDPREGGVSGPRCRNRSDPDSLFDNIVVHYGQPTSGSCYADMIDPALPEAGGFIFRPDLQDSLDAPAVPNNPYTGWNHDIEVGVTTNIKSTAAFIAVSFDSTYQSSTTTTNPTTETRYYYYHLLYQQTGQPDTTRYQGRAEITMKQGPNSLWTITVWRDQRDGSGRETWGILRANKRGGL